MKNLGQRVSYSATVKRIVSNHSGVDRVYVSYDLSKLALTEEAKANIAHEISKLFNVNFTRKNLDKCFNIREIVTKIEQKQRGKVNYISQMEAQKTFYEQVVFDEPEQGINLRAVEQELIDCHNLYCQIISDLVNKNPNVGNLIYMLGSNLERIISTFDGKTGE